MSEWEGVQPIEIRCGIEAMWGLRNKALVPIGSAITLRNASLEDHTFRTGGGAAAFGVALTGTPKILAGIDWRPSAAIQRQVVASDNGKISKDDGAGSAWVDLATGLTAGGNPMFVRGGAESAGRNRKLFMADGVNPVKVLSGNGATATTITSPPADWAGANQPAWLCNHNGALWGGGNANDPHRLYKSQITDHEDFLGGTPYSYSLFPGEDEKIVAALSFKGGMLVWKFPTGVYFIDTTSAASADWGGKRIGEPGAAGPRCVALLENDVVWVSPDGSWHLISATNATGSVRAEDIAYRKLGTYPVEQLNLARLQWADLVYYSQKREVMLACSASGQTTKNRRLHMDLNRQNDQGERWLIWDRDANEALWTRKASTQYVPMMGDSAGLLWSLDQAARTKSGAGYTFEAFISDSDFGEIVAGWAGRRKNGHYIQLEHDPRTQSQITFEIWHEGVLKQSISFTLVAASATTLPFTLPATFGAQTIQTTKRRKLVGGAIRWALRIISTGNNADVSIGKIILGLSLGD